MMDAFITAKLLDQIGLLLGLFSGLLLIPEVLNFVKIERLSKIVERQLDKFGVWLIGFALSKSSNDLTEPDIPIMPDIPKHDLPSTPDMPNLPDILIYFVKYAFALAYYGIPTIISITLLVIGIVYSSKLIIVLGILIPLGQLYIDLEKRLIQKSRSSTSKVIVESLKHFFRTSIGAAPILLLIVFWWSVIWINVFFTKHGGLRISLTVFAIVLFIISNILQFIATLL